MRYIQSGIPQPNKVYSFSLNSFVGGLNNRDALPEENQCTDVLNMAFTADGVMEKRKGVEVYDALTLDNEITFIDEFKPHQETNILVRATKNKVYFGNTLIRTNANQMYGLNHEGKYFFADSSGLYVYGKFTEEAGTYVKIIGTRVTDYVLMEVVSPPEGFTPLGTEHTEGVRNIDFTNRKVWYEPCQHEIKDTFKGANVVPKDPRFMVGREGRMYVSGSDDNDDTVYITDTGNPYYFPVVLSLQLPPNSDRISGLAVFNDAIIVGRRLDVHAIHGDTNRTDAGLPVYRLKKLNSHTGVASQGSMINAHNYLFYLGTDGQFYALRTTDASTDQLMTTVISKDLDIFTTPVSVTQDDLWYARGIYFKDCYYVAIGNKILIYSYLHQSWTMYDNINASSFYSIFEKLLIGTKDGKTLQESAEYLDLGKPYKALWSSRYFDMGESSAFKMYKDFFLVSRSRKDHLSSVNVLFQVDYGDLRNSTNVTTKFSIYGKSKWGDRYISRDINMSSSFPIYKRGRQIRITFWNGQFIRKTIPTFNDFNTVTDYHLEGYVQTLDNKKLYKYEDYQWVEVPEEEYNQGMCVMQLSGEYEIKWKR